MAVVATAGLTAAIAAGDETAFGAFYDAWFDATFALARAVSRRDEAFCLDVVQDVMLKVATRMPPLANEAAVQAWMRATVAAACIDRLRAEQRRQRRERGAAEQAADRAVLPEDGLAVLVRGERAAWLEQQIAALPAIERELLRARFDGAGSVTAAAAARGLGADQAHGRLRRCLRRLRVAAQEWWDG